MLVFFVKPSSCSHWNHLMLLVIVTKATLYIFKDLFISLFTELIFGIFRLDPQLEFLIVTFVLFKQMKQKKWSYSSSSGGIPSSSSVHSEASGQGKWPMTISGSCQLCQRIQNHMAPLSSSDFKICVFDIMGNCLYRGTIVGVPLPFLIVIICVPRLRSWDPVRRTPNALPKEAMVANLPATSPLLVILYDLTS